MVKRTAQKRMKNKYRNEAQGRYRIIYATKWSKGGRGERRTRLIVIAFPIKNRGRGDPFSHFGKFALRWQTPDGATFGGGSFNSREDAHHAFLRRYVEHNENYRKGNISHLPGMAK